MFITGYALILGAGCYSIYTISIFFLCTLLSFIYCYKAINIKKDMLIYLCFAVYAVSSTCYANYKWGALLFSSSILSGSLFYIALRNSTNWKEKILYTLIICGIVNGIFGIYQAVDQAMVSGLFYDKNAYSGFLTPVIPLSIYLQLKQNKKYLCAATSFLIFSNLLSHSRAGICTTILALFIIAFHLWKNIDREKIRILALSVIFGFYSYLIFSYILELFVVHLSGLTEGAIGTSIARFYIFKKAIMSYVSAPIFGHGIYSFQGIYQTFINPLTMYEPTIFSHAHNIFLNILVELGIAGCLLFLYFLFLVIRGPFFSKGFFFKIAFLSFFLHNMYEYNFTAPPFQVLLTTLSALLMNEKEAESYKAKSFSWIKSIFMYVLLCFFAFVYIPNITGYFYSEKAKKLDNNYKQLSYSAYFGYLLSGAQKNLGSYYEKTYFFSNKENNHFFELAENYYLKALALDNLNGDLYIDIAKFYYRTGREGIAEEYLLKAAHLFPYQPIYKYEIARYYGKMNKNYDSIRVLLETNEFLHKYSPLSPFRINIFNELAEQYKKIGDIKSYNEYNEKIYRLTSYLKGQNAK